MVPNSVVGYSLSKPCLHCSKVLRHYSRERLKKGSRVWVRYSLGGDECGEVCMSEWILCVKLEDGVISSGWREKYRLMRNNKN
jgi:hypothetical protein